MLELVLLSQPLPLLSLSWQLQSPPPQVEALPQLGPLQLAVGENVQLALLSLQALPQVTFVERGGSVTVPPSGPGPGNVVSGAP
ncbi:MAG TPA: hypothetical protein VGC42_24240 [Kofleriaceae bacterium]